MDKPWADSDSIKTKHKGSAFVWYYNLILSLAPAGSEVCLRPKGLFVLPLSVLRKAWEGGRGS